MFHTRRARFLPEQQCRSGTSGRTETVAAKTKRARPPPVVGKGVARRSRPRSPARQGTQDPGAPLPRAAHDAGRDHEGGGGRGWRGGVQGTAWYSVRADALGFLVGGHQAGGGWGMRMECRCEVRRLSLCVGVLGRACPEFLLLLVGG